MYQYLLDLLPQAVGSSQAPLPPRALFAEFYAAPSSPHHPVFLSWFERVRSTLSVAAARIVSLLASGLPGSSLLPPRQTQYSVGSGSSWVLRLRLLLHCWLCLNVRFDGL